MKNTKKGGKPPTAVSANAHCPDLACMLWFWSVVCVSLLLHPFLWLWSELLRLYLLFCPRRPS